MNCACYLSRKKEKSEQNGRFFKVVVWVSNVRVGASQDCSGPCTLHVSIQNGHQEVVKLLLVKGAKVDQARNDGATPLYVSSQ